MATKPTPKKKAAPAAEKPAAKKPNPFTSKPAAKPAPAAEQTKEPKANPFAGKRDTKQAPLHAPVVQDLTPKAKSYSFYPEDIERVNTLRELLVPRSGKRVSDSVVVRVALAYLEDHLKSKDGSAQFEKQLREMLLRHS